MLKTTKRDPCFKKEFLKHEEPQMLSNARFTALVTSVLILAGYVLDYFLYPEKADYFLWIRIIFCVLTFFIYLFLKSEDVTDSKKLILASLLPFPVIFMVNYMIYDTDGISSSYYAGLNLILVGLVVVLRWPPAFSLTMSVIVIATYSLSIILCGSGFEIQPLISNYFYLIVNSLLVVFGTYVYENTRKNEYLFKRKTLEQASALEENNTQLMELDKMKTDFFSNISHELRTPLTIILGNCDRLMEKLSDQKQRDLVLPLRENGLRLLKLIDNLLDLVSLDQKRIPESTRTINLTAFLNAFALQIQPLMDCKNLTFVKEWFEEDKFVLCDELKLEKILNNLVINAIKFTPNGGRVLVSVSLSDQKLTLEVDDNGVGMPKEAQSKVFTRFWQVNSGSNRKFRGTGIGLNLVQNLVTTMNGNISLESEIGEGTKFTINIPILRKDALEGLPPQQKEQVDEPIAAYHREAEYTISGLEDQPELARKDPTNEYTGENKDHLKTVLIADDEPQLRALIQECLTDHYRVISAKDGWEAIELAKHYKPDLFILDYMMPEIDGLELIGRLKEIPCCNKQPIMMLTARDDEGMKLKALEHGVLDFLAKPFSPLELRLKVKNILKQESYKDEIEVKRKNLQLVLKKLKIKEAQLIEQEKLAALGRMSAGLIHEINNPLNYAQTASALLEREFQNGGEVSAEDGLDYLEDISEGVERVSKIIADLRDFTTNSPKQLTRVNLPTVFKKAQKMLSDQLEERSIQLEVNIPGSVDVEANELQLSQVFVNMIQNSILAILEKQKNHQFHGIIRVSAKASPENVFCSLWDNGTGISPDKLNMIFDPFYTSRDVGAGMGMGLSIVRQILNNCKAELDVESTFGKYTEFTITFKQ